MVGLKNRSSRVVVNRRIAMGEAGRPPRQLDHFQITGASLNNNNGYDKLAKENELLKEYDPSLRTFPFTVSSHNPKDWLSQKYEVRVKRQQGSGVIVWCHSDGETAKRIKGDGTWEEIPCKATKQRTDENNVTTGYPSRSPKDLVQLVKRLGSRATREAVDDEFLCPFTQNDGTDSHLRNEPRCRVRTELLMQGGINPNIGTLDRFRSHGIATADAIAQTLTTIMGYTGDFIQGIPLHLKLRRIKMGVPGTNKSTVHSVAHIELAVDVDAARKLIANKAHADQQWAIEAPAIRALLEDTKELDAQEAEFPSAVVVKMDEADAPSGSLGDVIEAEFDEPMTPTEADIHNQDLLQTEPVKVKPLDKQAPMTLFGDEVDNKDKTGGDR